MKYEKEFVRKGSVYLFHEEIGKNGYNYWISICYDDRQGEVEITEKGVSIQFDDDPGAVIDTNIKPLGLFGRLPSLNESHLKRIMDIVSVTNCEGVRHTNLRELYDQWEQEGRLWIG